MNATEYLQTLPTNLLQAMASGEIDAKKLAAELMADRGLDQNGKWVGFDKAAKAWAV